MHAALNGDPPFRVSLVTAGLDGVFNEIGEENGEIGGGNREFIRQLQLVRENRIDRTVLTEFEGSRQFHVVL